MYKKTCIILLLVFETSKITALENITPNSYSKIITYNSSSLYQYIITGALLVSLLSYIEHSYNKKITSKQITIEKDTILKIKHVHELINIIVLEFAICDNLADSYIKNISFNQDLLEQHNSEEKLSQALEYASSYKQLFHSLSEQFRVSNQILLNSNIPFNIYTQQEMINLKEELLYWAEKSALNYSYAITSLTKKQVSKS